MSRFWEIVKSIIRALATVVVTIGIIIFAAMLEAMAFGAFVASKGDTLADGLAKLAIFLGIQPFVYFAVRWLAAGMQPTQRARPPDQSPGYNDPPGPPDWWLRSR